MRKLSEAGVPDQYQGEIQRALEGLPTKEIP
jgi:hypothetical protein